MHDASSPAASSSDPSPTGPQTFLAPWGTLIKITTLASVTLCLGISLYGIFGMVRAPAFVRRLVIAGPSLTLLVCAPFAVFRYTVHGQTLTIQRLGWVTRISLAGLRSVEHNPRALARSIRLAGNGGLFSFTGWFRNRDLGVFRLFGTEPKNAVILRLPARVIVITPERPQQFVAMLEQAPGLLPPVMPGN